MNLREATQLVWTADIVCELSDECEPLFPVQYADKEPPIQETKQALYGTIVVVTHIHTNSNSESEMNSSLN